MKAMYVSYDESQISDFGELLEVGKLLSHWVKDGFTGIPFIPSYIQFVCVDVPDVILENMGERFKCACEYCGQVMMIWERKCGMCGAPRRMELLLMGGVSEDSNVVSEQPGLS